MEARYNFIEKLCLLLYYACAKFRPYILSNTSTIVCSHDVVKHMLHKPVLSGQIGQWAYSIIEYGLKYEPLQATKGQVVLDFIVDHMIMDGRTTCLVETIPWRFFFDGSICKRDQGQDVS
jgi:hypothetical protein